MFQHLKMQWAQMRPAEKVLYSAIILCTVAAFLLLGLSGRLGLEKGPLYSLVLMGAAAVLQGVKAWKTGKFFSIFLCLFGAVFLIFGLRGLL